MSKTPRTDKFLKNTRSLPSAEWGEKAREFMCQLETELADKEKQLAEMRAEIERKDKLIEQMREALQWYKEQVSSCNRNGDVGELARDRLAKDVGKRAEAALAPERGK